MSGAPGIELPADVLSAIGRKTAPRTELVTRRDIRKYSIATNQTERKYLDGDVAPSMFHLALFWDIVELDQLMPDGVSVDTLLPKFPLEKAMAGGLELKYFRPIREGDKLTATRTLIDVYQKLGSQGPIIFYEVIMEVSDHAGNAVVWEKTTRLLR
ncbi:MAG: MaoC family dehydratase N-terminal domain-containing protein [Pseudomonadales bacterium]